MFGVVRITAYDTGFACGAGFYTLLKLWPASGGAVSERSQWSYVLTGNASA